MAGLHDTEKYRLGGDREREKVGREGGIVIIEREKKKRV